MKNTLLTQGRRWLLLFLSALGANAQSELDSRIATCVDAVRLARYQKALSGVSPLFRSANPISLFTPSNEVRYFGFSFDSEIMDADLGRLLLSHDIGRSFLNSTLDLEPELLLAFSKNYLGHVPDGPLNSWQDLDPKVLGNVVQYTNSSSQYLKIKFFHFVSYYRSAIAGILFPDFGAPMMVDFDTVLSGINIFPLEVRHQKYSVIPAEFAHDYARMLGVARRTVHLHLGIPSDVVSEAVGLQIARFLETIAVLRIAEEPNLVGVQSNLDGSPLAGTEARNYIRFEANRFKGAHPSHDLQIRISTTTLDDGLDQMEAAIEFALRAKWVITTSRNFGLTDGELIMDKRLGNIKGALEYSELLLLRSGLHADDWKRREARVLAAAWKPELRADADFYVKVRDFVKRAELIHFVQAPSLILNLPPR